MFITPESLVGVTYNNNDEYFILQLRNSQDTCTDNECLTSRKYTSQYNQLNSTTHGIEILCQTAPHHG